VLLHELGHSVVALRYKIPVRRITLFIFGGVAEIGTEPPSASAEFFIAIAGPIVSFALAILFSLLQIGVGASAPLLVLARYLAMINGSLALFNLIPGFPLDGGRVFRALVWGVTHNLHRATWIAANLGRVIGLMFVLFGVWQILTGDLGGLWFAFIGWYLQGAASSQLEFESAQNLLAGHPVSEAMSQQYIRIPANLTLQQAAEGRWVSPTRHAFVVDKDDAIVGWLSEREMDAVPRERWSSTTAGGTMIPMARLHWVEPGTEIRTAAEEMVRRGIPSLPVVANGHLLGIISREDVMRFLHRLQMLRRAPV
jgi:Zn-dependent protease